MAVAGRVGLEEHEHSRFSRTWKGARHLNCFEHMVQTSRHVSNAFWNALECNVSDACWATPLGPRLPSEKSGLVVAALVAAAAMVAAPAAITVCVCARRSRACAALPSAISAAATKPGFSDGNLGPDSTDGNLEPCRLAQDVPAGAQMDRYISDAF